MFTEMGVNGDCVQNPLIFYDHVLKFQLLSKGIPESGITEFEILPRSNLTSDSRELIYAIEPSCSAT